MKSARCHNTSFEACYGPRADPTPRERRRHPRYLISKPVLVVPVLPDLTPHWEGHVEGSSVNLGKGGLRFEISAQRELSAGSVLIGVECAVGAMHYAAAEVCYRQSGATGTAVGLRFSDGDKDWIRNENLTPTIDPATFRFRVKLPADVLAKWCCLGVMRPKLLDWVQVCPECQAIPTFRMGCRNCGSSRLASCRLIHHFACAHVGYVSDFERDGEIVCPKCRMRKLVVGTDFEYLTGPYRCLDCNCSSADLEQVAQCVACGLRFPGHQAQEIELIGYHVDRLDPLAFLDSC